MQTDNHGVTTIECPTVRYDGEAECRICGRPIAYRSDAHPVPTICSACADQVRAGELPARGRLVRAGDGWREEE